MTTNLFVIANVKQLRTGGSFRILLPFFQTSWSVGVLNSAIRNFGGGVVNHPPPCTPLVSLNKSECELLCFLPLTRATDDTVKEAASGAAAACNEVLPE